MKTRRRNFSSDRLTITQLSKSSTENYEDSIPIDLINEILSRLPAKSVARCRCVSKLWSSSILCNQYFTELFLTRSHARPQILFACRNKGEFSFFSCPQPRNLDVNSSLVLCVNRLMHLPFNDPAGEISSPVHGFVCLQDKGLRKETVPVIFNPSTGQSLRLPKVKTRRVWVNSHFVYDPINKQFKVLSMSLLKRYAGNGEFDDEHQILTIETGKKNSWRMIKCIPPHVSSDDGICIDGVLYYRAAVDRFSRFSMIVCFDVRSEKFRVITIPEDSIRIVDKGILINYNGKLGSFVSPWYGPTGIELWVLEDVEKQEWSRHTCVLPAINQNLSFVGVTQRNEIVFSPVESPFCLFYYNIERNTVTKLEIQGIEGFEDTIVYTFIDHFEDVKLMQVL